MDIPIPSGMDRAPVEREHLLDPRDAPSEERRALIESAVTDAVKRALGSSDTTPALSAGDDPARDTDLGRISAADPRLRRAFERAMEVAWRVFLEELERGQ
jgi:hypothetical protein